MVCLWELVRPDPSSGYDETELAARARLGSVVVAHYDSTSAHKGSWSECLLLVALAAATRMAGVMKM